MALTGWKKILSPLSITALLFNQLLFVPLVFAEEATSAAQVVENSLSLSPVASVSASVAPILSLTSDWQQASDSAQITVNNVELNKTYVAPQNSKVTVKFTKLPDTAGKLTIKEVTLTAEQVKQTGALSTTAYDISSTMTNGTFEYILTLPTPKTDGVEVKSSEDGDSFVTVGGVTAQTDIVTITGLNHFTIFVVTGTISGTSASAFDESSASVVINEFVYNPSSGNEWVELYNKTGSAVDLSSWSLVDEANHVKSLSGSIPAHGFYVYENASGWLNNTNINGDGDTIYLKNNASTIDEVAYQKNGTGVITGGQDIGNVSASQSITRTTNGGATWSAAANRTKNYTNEITNVYVGSNVSGNEFGTPDYPFSTIQGGISYVASGGTVNVAAGTYNLTSPIVVNKVVTLTGDTAHPENVVINAPTAGSDKDVFQVKVSGVTIEGFTITGARDDADLGAGWKNAGIMAGNDGLPRGQNLMNDASVYSGLSVTIRFNKFEGNGRGIYLYGVKDSTISNNEIKDSYHGSSEEGNAIQFYFEGGNPIKNNTISNNEISNVRYGVLFDSRTRLMTNDFSGNLVEDNDIRNVWNGGIIFQGGSGTSGSPITIRNNTVTASTGAKSDDEQNEKGLIAVYANYSKITGNTISSGNDNGIWIDGSHHTVSGNSVTSSSKDGIRIGHYKETEPVYGPLINLIRSDIAITNNVISGNTNYGLHNAQSADTVSATFNDWGVYTNAGVLAKIFGVVDFSHYLDSSQKATLLPAVTLNANKTKVMVRNTGYDSTITVPSSVNNSMLDVSNMESTQSGGFKKVTLPNNITINANTSVGNVSVQIPAGIEIEGSAADWTTGVINNPAVQSTSSVSVPAAAGYVSTPQRVIEVGYGDVPLTFNKAVRIVIAGQADKLAAYSQGDNTTLITNTCSADNQAAGDALPSAGDCKINSGLDLVIWTKHFTKFITYTESLAPSPSPSPSPSSSPSSQVSSAATDGAGGAGAPAPVCNDAYAGGAPTLLSATATGDNQVTLIWSKAADPVTHYVIAYGIKAGEPLYGNPSAGGKNTTSYTINNLSGGTTYYFRVRAGNGCNGGSYSNELSATPGGRFIAGSAAGFQAGVLGVTKEEQVDSGKEVKGESVTSAAQLSNLSSSQEKNTILPVNTKAVLVVAVLVLGGIGIFRLLFK